MATTAKTTAVSDRHPVVTQHLEARSADVQLRIADAITKFAGSMNFVYIHAGVFAIWMLLIEKSPWPTLTLVVSLEAIFLSTFVMIGQNRSASFQQAKADHDFIAQERELATNTDLTRAVHLMVTELHSHISEPDTPKAPRTAGVTKASGTKTPRKNPK